MAVTAAGSRMSATTGKPSPPASRISRNVSDGSPVGRWLTPTSAPSLASRTAVALPMPFVAPVTRATLPTNFFSMSSSCFSEPKVTRPHGGWSSGQSAEIFDFAPGSTWPPSTCQTLPVIQPARGPARAATQ